jgi:small-conductance mechanosensitive channel
MRGWLRLTDTKSHLVIMAVVFLCLGATLWLQSDRYHNTPSYANLLDLIPAWGWGLAYLAAGALSIACLQATYQLLVVISVTYSTILVLVWWLAFWIRWATDGGTTIVNVLSWGVFLYLTIRSFINLADRTTKGEPHDSV